MSQISRASGWRIHHCHSTYEVYQVIRAMPNVTKKPSTHPSTLQLHAKARMARQTYSPNNKSVADCQLRVLYLIS